MAKKIARTDQARRAVREIDRETALDLLHGLASFLAVFTTTETVEILAVKHRKQAYR